LLLTQNAFDVFLEDRESFLGKNGEGLRGQGRAEHGGFWLQEDVVEELQKEGEQLGLEHAFF
jgi:hypothetical protein